MNKLSNLSKYIRTSYNQYKSQQPPVALLHLQGVINSESTKYVQRKIHEIPKKISALALLVDSKNGSAAQTHIIIHKLRQIAKNRDVQFLTFGQENCINTGYLLLSSGDKVFIDNSTAVGGSLFGINKLSSNFLKNVLGLHKFTYGSGNSIYLQNELSPLQEQISENKKKQIYQIEKEFSQQIQNQILSKRQKIKNKQNLENIYIGNEAVEEGFADEIGVYTTVLEKLYPHSAIKLIVDSEYKQNLQRFKALKIYFQIKNGLNQI